MRLFGHNDMVDFWMSRVTIGAKNLKKTSARDNQWRSKVYAHTRITVGDFDHISASLDDAIVAYEGF